MNENENNNLVCADCGETIENENYYTLQNGDIICEKCYDENYFVCENCENLTHYDFSNQTHDYKYICNDCLNSDYEICVHCGQIFENDEGSHNSDDDFVCNNCIENYYYTCESCGELVHQDNANYIDEEDSYICDECFLRYNEENGQILNYHEFSNWQLFKNENENNPPFYIGFELEIIPQNGDTSKQGQVLQILKENLNVVMAHDGSLDYGGFEIISHPQTFKYIMKNKEKIKMTFEKLTELGYLSHNTNCCGLHFHITRPENNDIIDRLWLILETYKQEIIRFSRRTPEKISEWARFLSDYEENDNNKLKALYYIKKVNKQRVRYMALNNTNSKTIEFRFFRGTLKFETFMACVEFINNLMTLCSNTKIPIQEITWDKLCKGKYINAYIKERGILSNIIPYDNSLEIIKFENKQKNIMEKINKIIIQYCKNKISEIEINKTNIKDFNILIERVINIRNKANDLYLLFDNLRYTQCYFNDLAIKQYLSSIKNFKPYINFNDEMNERFEKLIKELEKTI